MLRIALCDDDAVFLERFEKLIEKSLKPYTEDYRIYKYTNGTSLITIHKQAAFDVVFLDIDMPVDSGLAVAREFRESDNMVYIIFVTGHTQYVYDSFDVQPFNYIVKNQKLLFEDKLNSVIKLLFNHMKQNKMIMIEDDKEGNISVAYREIVYIESRQHYCIFHIRSRRTDRTALKVRKSIGDLEQELMEYDFVRVHKKYIVNLSQMISVDKNNRVINLRSNTGIIKLGPTYKNNVEEKFYDYLRKH